MKFLGRHCFWLARYNDTNESNSWLYHFYQSPCHDTADIERIKYLKNWSRTKWFFHCEEYLWCVILWLLVVVCRCRFCVMINCEYVNFVCISYVNVCVSMFVGLLCVFGIWLLCVNVVWFVCICCVIIVWVCLCNYCF